MSRGRRFARAIKSSAVRRVSACHFVEAAVLRCGPGSPLPADELIIVEPVTEAQALVAREGYRDFR
jgi:hypothetical protein